MRNYIELGKRILNLGHIEKTRIGETLALHNQVLSFNLWTERFPLMTTKFVGPKSIINETLWYLKGTTNTKYLTDNNIHVWDKFAAIDGEIGKTYSYQFRNFGGIDQFLEVIKNLNNIKGITSRRAIINLYNIKDLEEMSIPPCIAIIQFNLYEDAGFRWLDTSVYQRSADFCLGVPYDIAEMALLAEIVGAYTHSIPDNLTIFYSNIHVYKEHIETLKKQLEVEPKELPILIADVFRIENTKPEDLTEDMFIFSGISEDRKKFHYELF
jgi:thymidylate synthase